MDDLAAQVPKTLLGWISLIGVMGMGVLAFFNKYRSMNAMEARDLIDTLTKKIQSLEETVKDQQIQMTSLQAQNELLTKMVSGTDEQALEMRQNVRVALGQIDYIYGHYIEDEKRENVKRYTKQK